ncbi:exodeoxyribonuclease VII small subunit [bacterium]|jgi:exodeoxyribonuclease VII small subunit|nr:exodeoxyribonuclease VII small subunit [bacterium]
MAKKEEMTYSNALAELEEIVALIENEDIEMDSLLEKVKRASLLLKVCRAKLRETEEEVKKVLVDIGEEKEE